MQTARRFTRSLVFSVCIALAVYTPLQAAEADPENSTFQSQLQTLSQSTTHWKVNPRKFQGFNQVTDNLLQLYLWTKDNFNIASSQSAMAVLEKIPALVKQSAQADSVDVQALQAAYYLLQGERAKALDGLNQIKTRQPHQQVETVRLLVGEKASYQGIATWRLNVDKAQATARQFTGSHLAQAIVAEAIFEEIMEPSPEEPRLQQAETALRQASKLQPDNIYYRYQMGQLQYLQGQDAQAQASFDALLSQYPRTAILPEAIGNFYTWMKRYELSIAYYEQAKARDPEEVRIYKKLELLYSEEAPPQAVGMYLEAIDRYPDRLAFYEPLLRLFAEVDYPGDKMVAQLEALSGKHPDNFNIQQLLANVYYITQRDEQAMALYHKLLANNPKATELYDKLSDIYWQQKKTEEMRPLLAQALKDNPDFAEGYYWLGVLDIAENQTASAVTHLEKALHYKPDMFNAQNMLGLAYRMNKDFAKAQQIFAQLFRQDPRNVNTILNLGDTYYHQKDHVQAERYYKLAAQYAPYSPEVLFSLGNLYSDMNKFDLAIDTFQRAILLAPQDVDARNNLGNAYLQNNQISEAIDEFERIVRITPQYATAYYNMACAYALTQKKEHALHYLHSAIELDQNLKQLAQKDPDLNNLRKEKAFQELIQ